jgi:hypothetical protein
MMRKIINNSIGHDMAKAKFPGIKIFVALLVLLGN